LSSVDLTHRLPNNIPSKIALGFDEKDIESLQEMVNQEARFIPRIIISPVDKIINE